MTTEKRVANGSSKASAMGSANSMNGVAFSLPFAATDQKRRLSVPTVHYPGGVSVSANTTGQGKSDSSRGPSSSEHQSESHRREQTHVNVKVNVDAIVTPLSQRPRGSSVSSQGQRSTHNNRQGHEDGTKQALSSSPERQMHSRSIGPTSPSSPSVPNIRPQNSISTQTSNSTSQTTPRATPTPLMSPTAAAINGPSFMSRTLSASQKQAMARDPEQVGPNGFLEGDGTVDGQLDAAAYERDEEVERLRSDQSSLRDWAPDDVIPNASQRSRGLGITNAAEDRAYKSGITISNLPDWATLDGRSPTAHPISEIEKDLDWSLRSLLNEKVFVEVLEDPLGRHRFREYLTQLDKSRQLDLWQDTRTLDRLVNQVKTASEAIMDVYLSPEASSLDLSSSSAKDLHDNLSRLLSHDTTFSRPQNEILRSLYSREFLNFVKSRIADEAIVKLGSARLGEERSGLGDCFVLTNPRLRDHPIVLCSDGFAAVTGYPREAIVGRNCRFLQGPGTAPESVQRIRDGLNSGQGCTELLLNYRRDGHPFYCLLSILPLRDASGALVYFIGGQINVTGQLAASDHLDFLIGGARPSEAELSTVPSTTTFSPTMSDFSFSLMSSSLLSSSVTTPDDPSSPRFAQQNGAAKNAAGFLDNAGSETGSEGEQSMQASSTGIAELAAMAPPPPAKKKGMKLFGGGSKMMGMLSSRSKRTDLLESKGQMIAGAEAFLGNESLPIEDQINTFKELYSKLIVFKASTRRIIFVTRQLLGYCDLPCTTVQDLYASPLIHLDFSTILVSEDGRDSKRVREEVKGAVKAGKALSVQAGLQISGKSKRFAKHDLASVKHGMVHLTPVKDRTGNAHAYLAIFA